MKTRQHKPIQSTQQNVPIRDISDGIVITKDDRYVKILEVFPVPFFLKKISEQNRIGNSFFSMLKNTPRYIHLKSVSVPSDLSSQIKYTRENLNRKTNAACLNMGEEYITMLNQAQKSGITRRFFISFPFDGKTKGLNSFSYEDIVKSLSVDAERITAGLNVCGNEVGTLNFDSLNLGNFKLFYMLYNRNSFLDVPFETRLKARKTAYEEQRAETTYIPPADLIAPEKMSFIASRYILVDGLYYTFLYIPSYGYNSDVVCGWLDNFINSYGGVDVDIFLKRIPKDEVRNSITRSIGHSRVSLSETNDTTDSFESASSKLSSAYYLKNGLSSGQDFYYMSVIITVSGKNLEEINYKEDALKKTARQMDITLRGSSFECEQFFNAVLPTSMFDDIFMSKMKRNVLTDGAASLYPFTTFQMIDKDGLYIADDMSGSPVIIDLFNRRRFTNPHIFVSGESGSGKTITLMMLSLRAKINNMPVYIIAPEKENEFRRICEGVGGQFISIGAGSKSRLNIMEIFKKDDTASSLEGYIDGINSFESSSLLEEKIATLIEFISLNIKGMSAEDVQLLNEALINTYLQKGITNDNESLYADKEKTRYKEMPIMSDLVGELEKKRETRHLARALKLLTTGSGAHFDGLTNVNIDTDFVVIGLEHNTKDMLGLSVYAAMDFCWSQIKRDRTKRKFLCIDEWWVLAFNKIAAEKSLEISKIARAYSCSMIIATQQMSDILALENGKYGEKVLNNCATKILMSMKEKDAYLVREMINLSDTECASLSHQKPGQGLLIAGDSRLALNIKVSETEGLLTFTDRESILKYAKLKKQEEVRCEIKNSGKLLSLAEWSNSLEGRNTND